MLFIKSVVAADGQLQATTSTSGTEGISAAQLYASSRAVVSTDAPTSADTYNAGFRYTPTGELCVFDATAGLPDPVNTNTGVAMTEDGQICLNIATVDDEDLAILYGIALTSDGRIYADVT